MPRIADNTISTIGGGVMRKPMIIDPRGDGGAAGAALAAGARAFDTVLGNQRREAEQKTRNILSRGREMAGAVRDLGAGISAGLKGLDAQMERRAEQEANAAVADYLDNLTVKCNEDGGFFSADVTDRSIGAGDPADTPTSGSFNRVTKWSEDYRADPDGAYAKLSGRAKKYFDRKTAQATDAARRKALDLQVQRAQQANFAAEVAACDQMGKAALSYAGRPEDFAHFSVLAEDYAKHAAFIEARKNGCRFAPGSTAEDFRFIDDETDGAIYRNCVEGQMAKMKAQGVKALLDTAVNAVDDDEYAEKVFGLVGNLSAQEGYTRREGRAARQALQEGKTGDELKTRAAELMETMPPRDGDDEHELRPYLPAELRDGAKKMLEQARKARESAVDAEQQRRTGEGLDLAADMLAADDFDADAYNAQIAAYAARLKGENAKAYIDKATRWREQKEADDFEEEYCRAMGMTDDEQREAALRNLASSVDALPDGGQKLKFRSILAGGGASSRGGGRHEYMPTEIAQAQLVVMGGSVGEKMDTIQQWRQNGLINSATHRALYKEIVSGNSFGRDDLDAAMKFATSYGFRFGDFIECDERGVPVLDRDGRFQMAEGASATAKTGRKGWFGTDVSEVVSEALLDVLNVYATVRTMKENGQIKVGDVDKLVADRLELSKDAVNKLQIRMKAEAYGQELMRQASRNFLERTGADPL